MSWDVFIKLCSPKCYLSVCRFMSRWLFVPTLLILSIIGVWLYMFGPIDQLQGIAFRWIYIHVPTAFASMALYFVLALCQMITWGLHLRVTDYIAGACASVGLVCTCVAIITGGIWGYATWGVWWVWDPRLTTELMLMVFYIAFIMARQAALSYQVPTVVPMIIAMLGLIHLPLIHYSVEWWHSLHQGSTLLNLSNNTLPWPMLWPLILILGLSVVFVASVVAKIVLKYHRISKR